MEDYIKYCRVMKHNQYTECLYQYGYYSLLCLMDEYEQNEMYEECSVIIDVIREHNELMNDNLPTRKDDMSRVFQKFRELGLTGRTYQKNLQMYIEIIKGRVEKYMNWEEYFKKNPIKA